MNEHPHDATRLTRLTLAGILLVAFFLRFWQLERIPPGLTHDEAGHGQDGVAILNGARPVYETVGYGREPLYDYVVALAMAAVGRSDYLVLRWVSAAAGMLTVALTYAWTRRAVGRWEALLACAWLAVSFWAVSASRQALRSVMLPPLLTMAIYAWWRGAGLARRPARRPEGWFVLSGVFIAATLWTYMAARVTWVLLLVLPVFLLVTDRPRLRVGMLLALIVALLLAAPMFIWLQQHPGAEQRFNQLGQPLQLLATGDVGEILSNSWQALGMFTVRADDLWIYNVPGRPWLGLIDGALFYIGLAIALWRWRQPQYFAALAWLVAGLLPSLITGVSASATRAIAMLPVLYVFPAIAATGMAGGARRVLGRVCPAGRQMVILFVCLLLVAVEAGRTYHDYFLVWANDRDTRVAYHTTLFEIAHHLDRQAMAAGTTVVLSSIYPARYHDPYALEMMMNRHDLALRWVDGRGALVFPPGAARLVVPALAPLDAALAQAIAPDVRLLESRSLRPDDLNPRFDVYEWTVRPPARSITDDIELGHMLALIRYDLSPQTVAPGGQVTLVTCWRIISPPEPELDTVLFTHLLSAGGQPPVIAQQDRLDAPTWNWRSGEIIAQVHRLNIGADVAEGLYSLEVGAYTRPGPTPIQPNPPVTRLTVYINGQARGDSLWLPSVEVKR